MRAVKIALAAAAMANVAAAPAPAYPDCSSMIAEINRMRADPKGYAASLRDFRKGFQGDVVFEPGNPVGWQTEEGVAAVDEAIATLEQQRALPSLDTGGLLEEAAGDHVVSQAKDGTEGHIGADGTEPGDRVRRRGGDIYVAEVIAYGSTNAADALRQLIIDDGVADRGHREVLLDPSYKFAGAKCGPHPVWRQVCVIDLAQTPDGTA